MYGQDGAAAAAVFTSAWLSAACIFLPLRFHGSPAPSLLRPFFRDFRAHARRGYFPARGVVIRAVRAEEQALARPQGLRIGQTDLAKLHFPLLFSCPVCATLIADRGAPLGRCSRPRLMEHCRKPHGQQVGGATAYGSGVPNVISRGQWGAAPPGKRVTHQRGLTRPGCRWCGGGGVVPHRAWVHVVWGDQGGGTAAPGAVGLSSGLQREWPAFPPERVLKPTLRGDG